VLSSPAVTASAVDRPVLAVFLDGLGADAIERMPFLARQATVRRVRTELGYSITCHASMYTGLRPDRHGLWFVWQRDPERSPFRWLRPFRFLNVVDNLPMHVVATKVTRRFVRTTSWFGIPYPVHVPWRDIPDLDVAERRLWNEPGYLAPARTIFDVMRDNGMPFEIVGMERGPAMGMAGVEAWEPPASPTALSYLFAGDIDHASHAHGQGSDEVTRLLGHVDGVIEAKLAALARGGADPVLVVWSDHGHHDVQRLNPLPFLRERGFDIRRHPHVIDTNFIRLWVDEPDERRRVVEQLDGLGIGHVLTDGELRRHRVRMPDDRYGNVIFYVELPWALSHTIWGFGRRLASAHGYLPDHPGSDAVLVSNLPARDGPLDLVDVAPSLLELLGLPVDPDLDGRSAWPAGAAAR
jgi:predicted AlkP superfamily pyrophosphatase or phosphodiesterase